MGIGHQKITETLRHLALNTVPIARLTGRLTGVSGLLLEAVGCQMETGERCLIETTRGGWLDAQVVGFRQDILFLMPFKPPVGLAPGARVLPAPEQYNLMIGPQWLGRIINGLGEPIDGLGKLEGDRPLELHPPRVNSLKKRFVSDILDVGIRAINGILTLGRGQRVGLFSGSGVGKSILLGMMTRQTEADVVIVGLIGERSREVREFIEHSLGKEGLSKAVLVVAPADESPSMRLMAAELCHCIAVHFREQGKHVLLLVDSLTRYAMARREIALALGEPPATKGYPPSVFSLLPQLVERAGNGEGRGTLSAIYTVLAEGDDEQDPVVDTARAILDGHIVLSRDLADIGHYPAIDISRSVSRCMPQIVQADQLAATRDLKKMVARYMHIRDLIPLGGYVPGADSETDRAVSLFPQIERFLQQGINETGSLSETLVQLKGLIHGA